MVQIAFILLCHKDPEGIIAQAQRLTAAGDCMAIHFDARAKPANYRRIREALADNPNVTFARRRVKCGWGEWSLVQASLNALEAAVTEFPRATHFYMLSGDCMAIKSHRFAHAFLEREDVDYIESFDFFESDWIKTGMKTDRLIYRHFFNERSQKWRFLAAYRLQKRLGLTRAIPPDLQVMIGSQWWCLRRRTAEWILDFTRTRRDVMRFFRTTWIPDETFFQTLVRHLVPGVEIRSRTLTFLMFSDYGMPVSFYNDHYELLLAQDFLFARKISPEAQQLKERLGDLYASERMDFEISNEGRTLYSFVTQRGRVGRRYGPRFWERESTIGRDRELLVIACKKWHVGKRLAGAARRVTGLRGVDYLFNEEAAPVPELGGIQTSMAKRTRHRRSLMRMLFDYYQADRLMLCVDPADLDLVRDFDADRCQMRLLEVECLFDDAYLAGHARRVGLAGENTPSDTLARLLPAIRNTFTFETDQLRDAGLGHHFRVSERQPPDANAAPLAGFFGIPADQALAIARTNDLFAD